jgi:hypothetical protein
MINLLDTLWATLRFGWGVKYEWLPGDWYGRKVELLLMRYGIRTYNRQMTNKQRTAPYGLHVRAQQAGWAEYLLQRAGVPVITPMRYGVVRPGAMPRAWGVRAKPVGIVGWLLDLMWAETKKETR